MKAKLKLILIALTLGGFGFVNSIDAQEVFRADYDSAASGGTGNRSVTDHVGSLKIDQGQFFPGRCTLATTPLAVSGRPGTGVIRWECRQEDGDYASTKGHRSEFKFADQPTAGNNNAPDEIWYAWSIFLPNPTAQSPATGVWDGGDIPSKDAGDGGGDEIYIQIHAPDGINLGGNTENPPVAMYRRKDAAFLADKGKWRLVWRWNLNGPGENAGADLPLELGEWTDFVMRVVWSNNPASPGAIQLWKNGTQAVNQTSIRVGYANMGYTYFKQGVYAYGWNRSSAMDTYRAIAYYDEMKVFQGSTTYADMKPRGGPQTSRPR